MDMIDCPRLHARLLFERCIERWRRSQAAVPGTAKTWNLRDVDEDLGCRGCEVGQQRANAGPQPKEETVTSNVVETTRDETAGPPSPDLCPCGCGQLVPPSRGTRPTKYASNKCRDKVSNLAGRERRKAAMAERHAAEAQTKMVRVGKELRDTVTALIQAGIPTGKGDEGLTAPEQVALLVSQRDEALAIIGGVRQAIDAKDEEDTVRSVAYLVAKLDAVTADCEKRLSEASALMAQRLLVVEERERAAATTTAYAVQLVPQDGARMNVASMRLDDALEVYRRIATVVGVPRVVPGAAS